MSDYHIRRQGPHEKSMDVVFHVPVPVAGVNKANVSWRDVIVSGQGGPDNISSELADIDSAEEIRLKAGEIIEKRETVRFSGRSLSAVAKKAEIEARFSELTAKLVDTTKVVLDWFGYAGNVQ